MQKLRQCTIERFRVIIRSDPHYLSGVNSPNYRLIRYILYLAFLVYLKRHRTEIFLQLKVTVLRLY